MKKTPEMNPSRAKQLAQQSCIVTVCRVIFRHLTNNPVRFHVFHKGGDQWNTRIRFVSKGAIKECVAGGKKSYSPFFYKEQHYA